MVRRKRMAAGLCGMLLVTVRVSALENQPFSYLEGFEGDVPEFAQWATNGESVVNYIGPTDEMASAGKRSLKVDVTLGKGSYHYWGMRVNVPCEGRLTMSARILVGAATTARVGLGTNMVYPPTHHSGCGPIKSFQKPTAGWQQVSADLVAVGRSGRDNVLRKHTTGVTGDDAGAVMDRWALFVYGREGDRAVVYIDDVRIEGEVPDMAGYREQAAGRFAAAREQFDAQLAQWRSQVDSAEKELADLENVPDRAKGVADAVKAQAVRAKELLNLLSKQGYASQEEASSLRAAAAAMTHGPNTVRVIAQRTTTGTPFVVFAPERVVVDTRITEGLPLSARVPDELACTGCRGEYESVSAMVFAMTAVERLLPEVTELTGERGQIPAAAVDIKIVKWWYQGADGIGYSPKRTYVPELLLKDDALVRVDVEARENYLRSTGLDGANTYLLCSGETSENLAHVRPLDADTLQPVDIPAGSLREYWLTVHIPADAQPGTYRGTVSFAARKGSFSLPLVVNVHPFELAPSRQVYSIYYRAKLSADGQPTISSEGKSEEQYRAEIEDMKAHGVLYPTNYHGWDESRLRTLLSIRRAAGMPAGAFYNLGQSTGNTADTEQLRALQQKIAQWLALCGEFGYTDVYFYGIDEASGDRLKSQQATWQAVQDAGGKTFVACYKKTFEAMGSLLNCAVLAHWPDPDEAAKWHSVGSHAFCYANPQVGVEKPATYRRNFGLVLWKAGFDGAMDYAYQHGFHHIWNDFDDQRYRDHNFTYPTVDGVVDTLQWEGFREGVDDVRYVTTLEQAIAQAPPAQRAIAAQAQAWLDALEPKKVDLDEAREAIAGWIVRLQSNAIETRFRK